MTVTVHPVRGKSRTFDDVDEVRVEEQLLTLFWSFKQEVTYVAFPFSSILRWEATYPKDSDSTSKDL